MLPINYYLIIVAILASIYILATILLLIKKKKIINIISYILYVILIIISVICIKGSNDIDTFLDEHFDNASDEYTITYYILSKDKLSKNDLSNKTIYYYENTQYIDKALDYISNDINVTYESTKSLDDLIKSNIFLIDYPTYNIELEEGIISVSDYNIIYEFKLTYQEDESDVEVEETEETKGKTKNEDTYNIYIGGYDFSNVRMDFNVLITYNMTTKNMLVTSIPRDYYLTIPGKNVKDTLSTMSPYGVSNNIKAIENLFGIKIDYYLTLETTGLVKLVDTIGGITYCSDKAYITDHALVLGTYDDTQGEHLQVVEGCQSLNGIETLTVARERMNYVTQDIARIQNDAKIMNAILTQMKKPINATRYNSILEAVGDMYKTTIPKTVIQEGVKSLINSSWKITNQYVVGKTYMDTCELSGQYKNVMVPNNKSVSTAKSAIYKLIYTN
jgi:LCP family protein required for cell wall assembly